MEDSKTVEDGREARRDAVNVEDVGSTPTPQANNLPAVKDNWDAIKALAKKLPMSIVKEKYGIAFRPDQVHAIMLLGDPKNQFTHGAVADLVGVSRETIWRWYQDSVFQDAIFTEAMMHFKIASPRILASLMRNMSRGNQKAIDTSLRLLGKLRDGSIHLKEAREVFVGYSDERIAKIREETKEIMDRNETKSVVEASFTVAGEEK